MTQETFMTIYRLSMLLPQDNRMGGYAVQDEAGKYGFVVLRDAGENVDIQCSGEPGFEATWFALKSAQMDLMGEIPADQ